MGMNRELTKDELNSVNGGAATIEGLKLNMSINTKSGATECKNAYTSKCSPSKCCLCGTSGCVDGKLQWDMNTIINYACVNS